MRNLVAAAQREHEIVSARAVVALKTAKACSKRLGNPRLPEARRGAIVVNMERADLHSVGFQSRRGGWRERITLALVIWLRVLCGLRHLWRRRADAAGDRIDCLRRRVSPGGRTADGGHAFFCQASPTLSRTLLD